MSRFAVRVAWASGDGSRAIVSRHDTAARAAIAAAAIRATLGVGWNVWAVELELRALCGGAGNA